MNSVDRVLKLIEESPGLTQQQIADALFAPPADARSVIDELWTLRKLEMVERRGVGGAGDPYMYFRIKRG